MCKSQMWGKRLLVGSWGFLDPHPCSAECETDSFLSLLLQCRIMASHKRILGTLGNGPVRRNLFGPVDREQLQVEYQAALRKDLEDASNRWGFDFLSDQPMERSDFLWEGVPGSKVPLLYRSCTLDPQQPQRAAGPKVSRLSASSEKENIPRSPERCPSDMGSLEKTPEKRQSRGLKRKQTNITGTDTSAATRAHSCRRAWAKLPLHPHRFLPG